MAAGRRVVLLVLDNFRYDQWRVLAPELAADFDAEEQVYFSILPTATQYARNALFAGMMPLDIARTHPDLWVDEESEEGKNLHEAELLERQLAHLHRRPTFAYHKLNDSAAVDKWLSSYDEMRTRDLSVAVINFIDILSHARTESRMVRELASNEAAYRSITLSWFRHTGLRELFRRLAADDADVVLTTDHGSIRVDRPVKVVGDRNVNTNLRYKLGRNLSYPAKEVFEVRNPADLRLPAPNLSTTYIFATGARSSPIPTTTTTMCSTSATPSNTAVFDGRNDRSAHHAAPQRALTRCSGRKAAPLFRSLAPPHRQRAAAKPMHSISPFISL